MGKAAAVAMDVRSLEEVKTDSQVDAALTAKFLAQDKDRFGSISALVFAGRVVLVGFAPTPEVRSQAEAIAKSEGGFQRFKDLILVGSPDRNKVADMALDAKINAALTAAPGVHSVNMRWKVFGGDIFLMGLAGSRQEAVTAVAAIEQLEGVRSVHSALDIGKT